MIHKYKLNGYNIVLDTNSGGVHIVDDITYDLLDNVEPPFEEKCPEKVMEKLSRFYPSEEIISCYDEIKALYNDRILFSEDDYEKFAKYSVASPIKAMCLHIAHDCNLRCEYCFASTGDFGKGRKLMSFETGKKAIDFLLEKSGDRENLELDFFGGEPLLNFEVVKQIVEYARSKEKDYGKRFRFTITTNGVLLDDDKIDFINKEMSNVVLSIDGRKEVNDKVRKRVDGTGCYDSILPKFKRLVSKRGEKEYYVRGTFTKYNLDFSEDVFSLYNEGFDQISVEPVVCPPEVPYSLTEKELSQIFKEYEKLSETIKHREWSFMMTKEFITENHIAYDELERLLNREKSLHHLSSESYKRLYEALIQQKANSSGRLIYRLTNFDGNFSIRFQRMFPECNTDELLLASMIHHQWRMTDMTTIFHASPEALRKRKNRLAHKISTKLQKEIDLDEFLKNL